METILIFGSGGHAKCIVDTIELARKYRIAAILDKCRTGSLAGHKVLPEATHFGEIVRAVPRGIVGIGDNFRRGEVVRAILAKNPKFTFVTAIHPDATVARDVAIDAGTVVFAGAIINAGSRVARHCIISTNASADHDNYIGDYVTLAPGAVTGGAVTVKEYSFVGLRAAVIQGVTIGPHVVIGAGSVVLGDIASNTLCYGIPARRVRSRQPGEPYLVSRNIRESGLPPSRISTEADSGKQAVI